MTHHPKQTCEDKYAKYGIYLSHLKATGIAVTVKTLPRTYASVKIKGQIIFIFMYILYYDIMVESLHALIKIMYILAVMNYYHSEKEKRVINFDSWFLKISSVGQNIHTAILIFG